MGESTCAFEIKADVLGEGQEFPEWRQGITFPQVRKQEVECYNKNVCRENTEDPFGIKGLQRYGVFAEQLACNEEATEYEKEVYACPAKTTKGISPVRMTEKVVMEKEDEGDSECAKMVKPVKLAGDGRMLHSK